MTPLGVARRHAVEQRGVRRERDRESVLVIAHRDAARLRLERHAELAAFEYVAVRRAEHRQEHLAVERAVERMPVDIEMARVERRLAFLEDVGPPGVVGAGDAHVVRHEVEQQAEPVRAQRLDEAGEALGTAELFADLVVGDDVVAVHAAGTGARDRRAVDVAHAEPREIRQHARRIGEREVVVQLQAIRCARNARRDRRSEAPWRTRPQLGERFREGGDALVRGHRVETDAELAAPVRLLDRRSRQVRLFAHVEHVLELHHHHRRRRRRERAVDGRRELRRHRSVRVGIARGLRPGLADHGEQAAAILGAHGRGRLAAGIVEQAELTPQGDVAAVPPAGERWQVVRRDGDQRVARVRARQLELALRVALEIEQPVRQDSALEEVRAHFVGHRAEVLADHHAAVAMALEGDDREQLVRAVVDVGAVLRAPSRRDPEQAHQAHDVVDAQRAGVAHVGAQRLDDDAVAGRSQSIGPERRQAPGLAFAIELVGGRADARTERVDRRVRPGIGPGAVDRDGEVEIEADRHAALVRDLLRAGELGVGDPLEVLVELDLGELRPCVLGDTGRCRITPALGPDRPAPHRGVGSVEARLQGLELGEPAQPGAAFALEGAKGARALVVAGERAGAKALVEERQHLALGRSDAGVVDELARAQPLEPVLKRRRADEALCRPAAAHLGDCFDVDADRVQPLSRRGAVRADVRRVVTEERVQRIEADDAGATCAPLLDQTGEIAEVADAPVLVGAQRIQLHGRAEDPAVVGEGRWSPAPAWCRDYERLAGQAVDAQAVVARRQGDAGTEQAFDHVEVGALRTRTDGESGGVAFALTARAVFLRDRPREPSGAQGCRDPERERRARVVGVDHRNRRQCLAPVRFVRRAIGGDDGRPARGVDIERREQRDQVGVGHAMAGSPDVVVLGGDAVAAAQPLERGARFSQDRPASSETAAPPPASRQPPPSISAPPSR